MEKELYRKIRYINRYKVRWITMWLILLVVCLAICSFEDNDGLTKSYYAAGFVLSILFPLEYYRKFNNLLSDRHYKDQNVVGDLFQKIKLSTILNCHSFSASRFIKILAVRLLPYQIIALILNVLCCIAGRNTMSNEQIYIEIGIALAVMVFPFCVAFIYYRYMEKELTSEGNSVLKVLRDFGVSAVVSVAELVCSIQCMIFLLLFVVFGLIDGIAIDNAYGESFFCISYNGNAIFLAMCMLFLAFLYLMWDQGDYFISPRISGKLRIIVGIILVFLLIYHPINAIRNHIEMGKDGISIVRHGKAEDYALGDITYFQIYPKDGFLKVAVDFSNGVHEVLFRDDTASDDDWADRIGKDSDSYGYNFEYEYTLYLAQRLTALGIDGEIKDAEELRRIAKEYDEPEILKIFEEIEKYVGVAEP